MMNRRAAILSILGSGVLACITFFRVREWYQNPELEYLSGKRHLLAEIADTIIPRTDTPGAKDAQVGDFIIVMICDCTEQRSQNSFISGLKSLEKYTFKTYNKDFISCDNTERISVLTHFENKGKSSPLLYKIRHKLLGDSFIHLVKYYTVMGYCTSEAGATKGLAYDDVPGSFEACVPLTSHHKCWATE